MSLCFGEAAQQVRGWLRGNVSMSGGREKALVSVSLNHKAALHTTQYSTEWTQYRENSHLASLEEPEVDPRLSNFPYSMI